MLGMADGNGILGRPLTGADWFVSKREVRYASNGLVYERPDLSCSGRVRHRSCLVIFAVLAGWTGLLLPGVFIAGAQAISIIGFTLLIVMRMALVVRGGVLRLTATEHACDRSASAMSSQILPVYSVLIPLYKEAGSVRQLVEGLKALDYPLDRLEVFFLVEQEDAATRETLEALSMPAHWPILILPDGQPRTKPRALNVALARLKGRFVTIYDAEDRPHPGQLKAAVKALQSGGADLACVQAPLRAYNDRVSWISGQWALEYDMHFGLVLPALAKARRPIALGGTSNHFKVDILRSVGGWDAWNVTEDADLGLRFARLGYRISTIDLPTLEEAPEKISIWMPQRSRWIKGYMQSASVLWRAPGRVVADMGLASFAASQVLLGGAIISACLHGPFALLCLLYMVTPEWTLPASYIALMLAGYSVQMLAALLAPGRKDMRRLGLVLTAPLYWPLQSFAAMRALYELATVPHMWSKTPHALTALDVSSQSFEVRA